MTRSHMPSATHPLAEVLPNWLKDGEPVTIKINGLHGCAGRVVEAHLHVLDEIEIWWHTSILVPINTDGSGSAVRDVGLSVGRHGAIYVSSVNDGNKRIPLPNVLVSIINSPIPGSNMNEIMMQYHQILGKQETLYHRPIGTAGEGKLEHRALGLLEGIYTTVDIRFPGAITKPIGERTADLERLEIVNTTLERIGWPTRVPVDRWSEVTHRQFPMTALIVPQIWASGFDETAELVRDVQDRIISLLALNRKASARRTALVIEQRQTDDSIKHRIFPPHNPYTGNLVGGALSGESQRHFTHQYLAIDADPLVRLCCDLYAEALTDRSEDARYLKLWAILELLSGARTPKRTSVTLSDGTPWPGPHGTTASAAPRLYLYVLTVLLQQNIAEASVVYPAKDLYEAVRVWYGRRNATGHHGKLIIGDQRQANQPWYKWAIRSLTDGRHWLDSLTRVVELALHAELAAYTPDLS